MNTIRISRKAILTFFVILLFLAYVILPKIASRANSPRIQTATFRTDKSLGNYETVERQREGPGEKGLSHHVRSNQVDEENRLKGNPMISCC